MASAPQRFSKADRSRPIIYLDNADYSRFTDVVRGRNDPIVADCLAKLSELVEQDRVLICYSMPLLSEGLQYQDGGADLTRAKAEVVEKLCRSNAFRYVSDILTSELAHVAHQHGVIKQCPPFSVLSTEGVWYPAQEDAISQIPKTLDEEFQKILRESGLSRQQRRQARKELFRSPQWEAQKQRMIAEAEHEFGQYPGMANLAREGKVTRMIEGRYPAKTFERELFGAITSPTNFIHYYFERHDGQKDIPSWMRGFSELIYEAAMELKRKTDESSEFLDRNRLVEHIAAGSGAIAKRLGTRMLRESTGALMRMGLGAQKIEKLQAIIDSQPLPTLVLLDALIIRYVQHLVMHPKNAPTPKKSDGADIMHALYIPHCHIWRGDKRSAELFRPLAKQYQTECVLKFEQLPAAVDEAMLQLTS